MRSRADSLALEDRPSMADYYSDIAQAVSGLPSNNTDEARREIYERARRDDESRTTAIPRLPFSEVGGVTPSCCTILSAS